MKLADLENARVAVWGAGSEGIAALHTLRSRFPDKELVLLEENSSATVMADEKVRIETDAVTTEALERFDVVVRSPGISIYREEIIGAKTAGVTFTSGTNLWFSENSNCRTICVTGSKGKSTTSHLIHHLLRAAGVRAVMAGNMGEPLLNLLNADETSTFYVVELSSYQLSDFTGAPTVAVLLNLYPEHLDWHKGEQNYFRDKTRLFDTVVQSRITNWEDDRCREYSARIEHPIFFNSTDGFHHDATTVYLRGKPWIEPEDNHLLGAHNLSNICAALTAVSECGVELDKETVGAALRSFKGLNHRLTKLGERDGVLYVNDSIATIPQATVAALRAFSDRTVTVLVGGYDRGLDQREFARMIFRESPFAVVTLPVTGTIVYQELRALASQNGGKMSPAVHEGTDLDHAVSMAREITPPGAVILLSPGAPSFNSYPNFKARGEAFAKAAGLPFEPGT